MDWNYSPAVSPDGRRVAFVAPALGGKILLWIRSLDGVAAQPVPGTERASYPFWSPDGAYIGFFAERKLKKIAAVGGPVQSICDVEIGRGGTWNRDGTILFAPSSWSPIYRVPAAGGKPSPVTHLEPAQGEVSHRWPQFLPDGRHFLYFEYVDSTSGVARSSGGVYAGSLDGMKSKLVLTEQSNALYAASGYLLFHRDRNLLAQPFDAGRLQTTGDPFPLAEGVQYSAPKKLADFSVSDLGTLVYTAETTPQRSQRRWFDRAGREISSLGNDGSYKFPRLSPDGKRVAIAALESANRSNIWVVDTARATTTRLTAGPFEDADPSWFPDSERIAFSSSRGSVAQMFTRDGESPEKPLRQSKSAEHVTDISPDGRFVSYSTFDPKTGWDLWVMDLTGKQASLPFVQTPFYEGQGQFSPDGQWLAHVSEETGKREIYVAPFPGPGARVRVSTGGGTGPRWRRDAKELFYLVGGRKLMAVEINSTSRFGSGIPKMLFELRSSLSEAGNWEYDVSADGQRFLVNVPEGERAPSSITVVLNWTAGLKKER